MKSRLQPALVTLHQRRVWRVFWVAVILLLGLGTAAFAQDQEDPPGRVAFVSYRQGGVVFAPEGEDEWTDLPANRPLTAGDRVWTDRGARAELQVGTATVHIDGESHVGVSELDDRALKVILQQGSLNLRVRDVTQGENIEVDTPNLAFRALQPGDYRIDVDARGGDTRVTVQSGMGSVYGERGEAARMGAGQDATFAGRSLAQVQAARYSIDDFAAWAAERNRAEDQSITARYVPRGVVGYAQLDPHGTWSQDPNHGPVWYPAVQVTDWAPYRYGHWSWISPWGWTWIDDAPWGFAPFHYGRWTMIADRWAWVPGRLAQRPVYSPALVVFLGGGGARLAAGSGPAVGWYPLAPGEAWWPVFRHSPRYVGFANYNINLNAYPRHYNNHVWRTRPFALTAVAEEDFRRGRPVYRHWQPLAPQTIGNSRIHVVPVRPELRHRGEFQQRSSRLHTPPPAVTQSVQPVLPRFFGGRDAPPAVREQHRAQREQDRLQREAERTAREQQRQAEAARAPHDARAQREQAQQPQPPQQQALPQGWPERRAQRQRERLEQQQREQAGAQPPARAVPPPQRPFVQQAAPAQQQAVPVPQQQVRPVQQDGQPPRGWRRGQQVEGEQPGARGQGRGRNEGQGQGQRQVEGQGHVQGQGQGGGWPGRGHGR
jgi:hypothetical protein